MLPAGHALCGGRVWHVRRAPFRHGFDYGVRMLWLDLDRLGEAFAGHPLWSLDRANLAGLRTADHLAGADGATLAERIRGIVRAQLGFEHDGAVHLLAQPRQFGIGFNPVTMYFCRNEDNLRAIVLEVSNTPWNERHVYALDCRDQSGPWHFDVAKDFHVSPFLPLAMRYRFRFTVDEDRLEIVKQNFEGEHCRFAARMALGFEPLSRAALSRTLVQVPSAIKVVGAIYWQALRLWLKGATYHPHPVPGARQGTESVS